MSSLFSRPARAAAPLLACLLIVSPAAGFTDPDEDDEDPREKRIAELEGEVGELRGAYSELFALTRALQSQIDVLTGNVVGAGDDFYIPRTAAEFQEGGESAQLGGIYTKPFLTQLGKNSYYGGYIDLEYTNPSGDGGNQEFDQHRLVPFIYADVSENVKVAAEIEYEHGSELEVEFAQMDFLINPAINFRAGIQLLPLGKLNQVHDSPIQDLTARPLVDRYIIPTTFRDAGVGVWGDISEQVSYNVTVSNGFKGLAADGTSAINDSDGLKNAAPQADELADPFENTNDKLAFTGRVAYKPVLGTEFGVSAHKDTYDEAGERDLDIWALDATIDGAALPFMPDNMELLYESAHASIERDNFAKASGVAGDMEGYYVQSNVHFEPEFLQSWKEKGLAEDDAHFTFVTRYDHVNLSTYDMRRVTYGLNYRPNGNQTVIKLDFQSNDDTGTNKGSANANAWLLSFASFF